MSRTLDWNCLTYLLSGRAGNKVALGFSLSTFWEKDTEEHTPEYPRHQWERTLPKQYNEPASQLGFPVSPWGNPSWAQPYLLPSHLQKGTRKATEKCN